MNNAVYGKTMERVRYRIDVKLISNKPSYMSHKILHNGLVVIRKNKVTLMLSKPAYIEMCILEFGNTIINLLVPI